MAVNNSESRFKGDLQNGNGEPPPSPQHPQQNMKQILDSVHSDLPSYESVTSRSRKPSIDCGDNSVRQSPCKNPGNVICNIAPNLNPNL